MNPAAETQPGFSFGKERPSGWGRGNAAGFFFWKRGALRAGAAERLSWILCYEVAREDDVQMQQK
tara:strand:+ start:219 stop:413 length:195 start_codon:yes stop_codon:yes gene_type:complete